MSDDAKFSVSEWIIAAALIVLIVGFLLPACGTHHHRSARRIQCLNNLRQIGLGIKQYATDHNNAYPEARTNNVHSHFRLLSNMVGNAGQIFKCPGDEAKVMTNTASDMTDRNISYAYVRGLNDSSPDNIALAFDPEVGGSAGDGLPLSSFSGQSWGPGSSHTEKFQIRDPFFDLLLYSENTKRPLGGNVLYSDAHVSFEVRFPIQPASQPWTNTVEVP